MARAMYVAPADAAAGGPAPSTLAASASAPTPSTSADDWGKCPQTMVPRCRRVLSRAGHIPPALRITRENAAAE